MFFFGLILIFIAAFSDGMDYGLRWLIGIAGAVICGLSLRHINKRKEPKRLYNH